MRFLQLVVSLLQPWGILIALIALALTWVQFDKDRQVRDATMIGLVADRLEKTRALQRPRDKVSRFNTGQVRMLETLVELSIDLSHMNLSKIYLRRIKLPGIKMVNVDLTCSDLTGANLSGADLTGGNLTQVKLHRVKISDTIFKDVDLYGASLSRISETSNADFSDAKFNNTRLRNLDLREAKGLTDSQVKNSCGYKVQFPSNITEKLTPCEDEQKREQKCEIPEAKSDKRLKKMLKELSNIRRILQR